MATLCPAVLKYELDTRFSEESRGHRVVGLNSEDDDDDDDDFVFVVLQEQERVLRPVLSDQFRFKNNNIQCN